MRSVMAKSWLATFPVLAQLVVGGGYLATPGSVLAEEKTAHEQGRAIYNFRCYFCHGYSGDANTLASTYLEPRPRDFTKSSLQNLSRSTMIQVVTHGKAGTAMQSFRQVLSDQEIGWVVDFVRTEFMQNKAVNTRYHTPENGWDNHEKYREAYPFARGELAIDLPWEALTPAQRKGKQLFLSTCITCHDRASVREEGEIWDSKPASFPRFNYDHKSYQFDATSAATPYARHEIAPKLTRLTVQQKEGEQLFQSNCAFCHAADGTAQHWIGRFLEPHPRDLTSTALDGMDKTRLTQVIENGLPGTTMSAWKSVLTQSQIEAVIAYIHVAFHPIKGLN